MGADTTTRIDENLAVSTTHLFHKVRRSQQTYKQEDSCLQNLTIPPFPPN